MLVKHCLGPALKLPRYFRFVGSCEAIPQRLNCTCKFIRWTYLEHRFNVAEFVSLIHRKALSYDRLNEHVIDNKPVYEGRPQSYFLASVKVQAPRLQRHKGRSLLRTPETNERVNICLNR